MKLKIEYLPIAALKTYANNAKVHTAEQIDMIKESIIRFGFNDPVAIWKNGEIIEGHGRLIAAKELGFKQLPIIRLDDLTDDERRAYILVHNKLTMNTGFDVDVLNEELEALAAESMDDFGFAMSMEDLEEVAEEMDNIEDELKKVICPRCGKVVAIKRR